MGAPRDAPDRDLQPTTWRRHIGRCRPDGLESSEFGRAEVSRPTWVEALVVDGQVGSTGKVMTPEEVKKLLRT